jgi:hypothetical protein
LAFASPRAVLSTHVLENDMRRLNPDKLHVSYASGIKPGAIVVPRRYTLTHSDATGDLYLTIGFEFDIRQISRFYTRMMRDEVLAELVSDHETIVFKAYCHVSGGLALGSARWRYNIFRSELPLVLEAFRFGDRFLFESNPALDQTSIYAHFKSNRKAYDKVEPWGVMADYR